ncbi:MAG: hypothetical protein WEC75_03585, partial [Dehalococcoidia bacterium]
MTGSIRVLVSGSGKMGRAILDALDADPSTVPCGVLEKFAQGDSLPLASGGSVPVWAEIDAAFDAAKADVVIDFTNAAWTPGVADAAVARGVRPVIGTSGLSEAFVTDLAP